MANQLRQSIPLFMAATLVVGALLFLSTNTRPFSSIQNEDLTIRQLSLLSGHPELTQFNDPKSSSLRRANIEYDTAFEAPEQPLGEDGGPTFVFLAGLEGVGHHFTSDILALSPNMKEMQKLGACRGGALSTLQTAMFSGGSQTRTYGLFNFHNSKKGYDSRTLFARIVKSFAEIHQAVIGSGTTTSTTSTGEMQPLYIPINANGCVAGSEMSYPTFMQDTRPFNSFSMDIYYDACKAAGVTCKHAYMYRDPHAILASAGRRHFNKSVLEGIELYTMQLQLLYAQMSYYSDRNVGCFGFLDPEGSLKTEDRDHFGELFGWESMELYHKQYESLHNKVILPMSDAEKAKLVPSELSVLMKAYVDVYDRVINLCYSTMN